MDRDLERRLARLEGKVNIAIRTLSWLIALGFGFGAYFVAQQTDWHLWARYIGFAAAAIGGAAVDLRTRQLEKLLPYIPEA
jgi:hypothetical protein